MIEEITIRTSGQHYFSLDFPEGWQNMRVVYILAEWEKEEEKAAYQDLLDRARVAFPQSEFRLCQVLADVVEMEMVERDS